MDNDIALYVFHRSYFCGKMMAYMRYREIPHTVHHKSLAEIGDELLTKTGQRVMPAIKLGDGRWMNDTTPMMLWLEEHYTDAPTLPDDPVTRFLVKLMEDYADEWLWRPAINSRWQNPEDRFYYKKLFPTEFVGLGKILSKLVSVTLRSKLKNEFLEGDGITDQNREHVWSIYTDTLDRLEAIFKEQPYLLGDKPCLADFGFFGSMFYHFSNDPTPNRIMQDRAPGVYEWVARMWNMTASKAEGKSFNIEKGKTPPHWGPLLEDVCKSYLPFLEQNAVAFQAGKKRFTHGVGGYSYPKVKVSPYRLWCRERLQKALFELTKENQDAIRNILEPLGGWEALVSNPEIKSEYDPENLAPFTKPKKIKFKTKLGFLLGGSSHVTKRRAWDEGK
jgi:glutathione S-transferase